MTLPAKDPVTRLLGQIHSRILIMLRLRFMAGFALERGMIGKGFHPGDVGMACSTRSGGFRGSGVMGIMARGAGAIWIVHGCIDLREPRGPRHQIVMADGALLPFRWDEGLDFVGILSMAGGWPMACFARQATMERSILDLHDIGMAISTDRCSGILQRLSHDAFQGIGAVIPQFTE